MVCILLVKFWPGDLGSKGFIVPSNKTPDHDIVWGPFLESPGNLPGPKSIFLNVLSPITQ